MSLHATSIPQMGDLGVISRCMLAHKPPQVPQLPPQREFEALWGGAGPAACGFCGQANVSNNAQAKTSISQFSDSTSPGSQKTSVHTEDMVDSLLQCAIPVEVSSAQHSVQADSRCSNPTNSPSRGKMSTDVTTALGGPRLAHSTMRLTSCAPP